MPTATGGRFAGRLTVTANVWVALSPPGSVAVTRIVAVPSPTAVKVTPALAALTVTTPGADETAV